uniref:Uncharacterized protein n=1 Tax=uncultured prokaryote TaxID=198431 RepID=A0A0H5Q2C0_9ZZZZ|nr:hypothetical protein [uncultured prokaryote]
MSNFLLLALIVSPLVISFAFVVALILVIDELSNTRAAKRDEPRGRQACSVCGAHSWLYVEPREG